MSSNASSPNVSSPTASSSNSHSPLSPTMSPRPSSDASSSSGTTVRHPSPLNPASHSSSPSSAILPLPAPDLTPAHSTRSAPLPSQSVTSVRSRGSSVSTIRPPSIPFSPAAPISRVVSTPASLASSTTTLSPPLGSDFRSRSVARSRASSVGQRGRSVSPLRNLSFIWRSSSQGNATPPNGESTSWWTSREILPRPWVEKKQKAVPVEQTEGYVRTRQRVAEAAGNVLGVAGQVVHDLLEVSVDVLRFAPLPGLEEAARTLLTIWDALQLVDINRLACLTLTDRCATILISIREEIAEAGDEVGVELHPPLTRLVESYRQVHRFLVRQTHRPFIKRYLQRDEVQRALGACDRSLTDALGMFNTSIQIRILKQVLAAEKQRQADTAAILDSIHQGPALDHEPSGALMLTAEPVPLDGHVLAQLQAVTARQNERNLVYDAADLRQLLRSALQANSDAEMIAILQVGRDEMPEAIKTLQRALEIEVERERVAAEQEEAAMVSAEVPTIVHGEGANLTRSSTVSSHTTSSTASSSRRPRDTLDREFIETGIDALRRLSGVEVTLPSWTITRYEVNRDEKIGLGFFSDVYRGTWRNEVVAIKVLAPTTPRQLFVHEISIWKTLQHPNVLELLGASSASSDPPWFFVSPYFKNGSLVTYLKGLPSLDSVDVLKMIHEIAKGMSYLHSKGVLHGDLKAANVLVNDRIHCVLSDFGQSEMKSEAYRLSGMPLPHGTLRWQAPELMAGLSDLTQEIDVYAFAITCVELLTKGGLPWPMADDDAVRHFVLRENMRPEPPLQRVWSAQLQDILHACWHSDPKRRPSFVKVDEQVQKLRARYGMDMKESPVPRHSELGSLSKRKSPDMHPIPLPLLPPDITSSEVGSVPSTDVSFTTAAEISMSGSDYDHNQAADPTRCSSRASSSVHDSGSEHFELVRHVSPPPPDEHAQNLRDERRYRMLLQHEFHPSLSLPLWTPHPVALGAVGYHSKTDGGEFITLFNSFDPVKTSGGRTGDMPSLWGYGRVNQGSQRQDRRNVAQRGMDIIQSWIGSRNKTGDSKYSRRYSSPLRAGHKTAHLFTESTTYRYIDELPTPKKWFMANVDRILALYGTEHQISREDLLFVIGTLEAQDYALFVSHEHPDGNVDFNVFTAARSGQPWGEFSFSAPLESAAGGPTYDEEPVGKPQYACKVSDCGNSGGRWDTVLIGRLRFKPDQAEPTSL